MHRLHVEDEELLNANIALNAKNVLLRKVNSGLVQYQILSKRTKMIPKVVSRFLPPKRKERQRMLNE